MSFANPDYPQITRRISGKKGMEIARKFDGLIGVHAEKCRGSRFWLSVAGRNG